MSEEGVVLLGVSSTSKDTGEAVDRGQHLAPEKSPRSATPGRLALSIAVAFAAGLAVAALLRGITPEASSFPVADRLQYYLDHQEDFDTLFVGTSKMYRGLVPAEFDTRMATLGLPTRSLNLGEPGMRGFEVDRLVRFLMKRNRGSLKYLVLDPGVRTPKQERKTGRSVEWHTARQTLAALRMTRTLRVEPWERWRVMSTHLKQFAMRQSNYGFGPELWQRLTTRPDAALDWLPARGYRSLEEETTQQFGNRRRRFERRKEKYRRRVARYRDREEVEVSAEVEERLSLGAEQSRIARAAGVQSVVLVSPVYGRLRGVERAAPPGLVMLNFDDSRLFPELFEVGARFDEVHLNATAAVHYTRLVADAFAAHLSRPGAL